MLRFQFLVALLCLGLSACSRSAPVALHEVDGSGASVAAQATSTPVDALGDYIVAAPVQHGKLTIFPVLSKTPRMDDRFVTLEEGLKAGTVQIQELGATGIAIAYPEVAARSENDESDSPSKDEQIAAAENDEAEHLSDAVFGIAGIGNDVNKLAVINRGDKPLYLMPGEIIVGGSQDRTIGEELVIAPTGQPVTIDVYCVEHGRWGAREMGANLAVLNGVDVDLDGEDAAEANRGKFVAQAGTLSRAGRLAAQAAEGQEKVWEEVATANTASGASWASGAFTANYVDSELLARLKPYTDALSRPISDRDRVVGIVVAINGKIETVDVFESTPLFRKLWPQLLKSFALDALQAADPDAEEARQITTLHDVEIFLAKVISGQDGETRKTEGGLVVSRHETPDVVSFSASSMVGGAIGQSVLYPAHRVGFAKRSRTTERTGSEELAGTSDAAPAAPAPEAP